MRVVILDDAVHQSCGGKIRERLYDDPAALEEEQVRREGKLKELFAGGHIEMAEFEERLANPPKKKGPDIRKLECLQCGAETAVFGGQYGQGDQVHQIKLVPFDTYDGRII